MHAVSLEWDLCSVKVWGTADGIETFELIGELKAGWSILALPNVLLRI